MIYGLLIDLKQSLNFLYELEIAQILLADTVQKWTIRKGKSGRFFKRNVLESGRFVRP